MAYYYEKMEQMVKQHFPDTKAFETSYWLSNLVNPYISGNRNTKNVVVMMMAAYISGVLVGEGHNEEDINDSMDLEALKMEGEVKGLVHVTEGNDEEEEF